MAYLTEVFPLVFSNRCSRQINYLTSVIKSVSGKAERNSIRQYPTYSYNVPLDGRRQSEIEQLLSFWHAAGGRANTFGLLDPFGYTTAALNGTPSATDQNLGTAVAAQTDFQARIVHTVGGQTRYRKITRPIESTILVAVDGVPTVNWSLDPLGVIVLDTPATGGEVLTWGGSYHVPVAFDDDQLEQLYFAYVQGQFYGDTSIRLAEDRE